MTAANTFTARALACLRVVGALLLEGLTARAEARAGWRVQPAEARRQRR
ncbi:hypothetical protein [Cupriavidus necator]|nr:hypothetical protein [Cupriavidus necator]